MCELVGNFPRVKKNIILKMKKKSREHFVSVEACDLRPQTSPIILKLVRTDRYKIDFYKEKGSNIIAHF